MDVRIEVFLSGIFACLDRADLIRQDQKSDLYGFLTDSMNRQGCKLLQIGGTANHVHFVVQMSVDLSVDELLKKSKLSSMHEMHRLGFSDFFWDIGYWAYSIGTQDLNDEFYKIEHQIDYHNIVSLDTELKELMESMDMEADDDLCELNEYSYN
jgi:REP element-mobilizing transposase RayT